eukprot:gene4469-3264_t
MQVGQPIGLRFAIIALRGRLSPCIQWLREHLVLVDPGRAGMYNELAHECEKAISKINKKTVFPVTKSAMSTTIYPCVVSLTLLLVINMGCGGSKEEPVKGSMNDEQPEAAVQEQGSHHSQPNPPARAEGEDGDAAKSDAPHSVRRGTENLEEENVILPKGEWVRAKDTPYYYSQTENLYYHPPSCQFYDPTNEMWYDSEKNEWYRDSDEDDLAPNIPSWMTYYLVFLEFSSLSLFIYVHSSSIQRHCLAPFHKILLLKKKVLEEDDSTSTRAFHDAVRKTKLWQYDAEGFPHSSPAFRFAEDYPEPLTELQRRSFHRHLSRYIYRYKSVHKTTALIQKGLTSLKKITDRLLKEKEYLQCSLEKPLVNTSLSTDSEVQKDRDGTAQASPATSVKVQSKRRGFGRLALIQNTLRSAQKEEESHATLFAQREKIAKKIRLEQVQKDLDEHLPHHDLLANKVNRCTEVELQAKTAALPLMSIAEEMMIYEPLYASAFSMQIPGSARKPAGAPPFKIPVAPAAYTPQAEEVIRTQIELVLDAYVGYRSRIDPILSKLDEEQQAKRAQRVDKLLDLIGAKDDQMEIVGLHPNFDGIHDHHEGGTPLEQDAILDSESDGDTNLQETEKNEEVNDDADRKRVQSALTALDDFQDVY